MKYALQPTRLVKWSAFSLPLETRLSFTMCLAGLLYYLAYKDVHVAQRAAYRLPPYHSLPSVAEHANTGVAIAEEKVQSTTY